MTPDSFQELRQEMLAAISAETYLLQASLGRSALSERVMAAMARVPRHEFVPIELKPYAYANIPLPIGFGKTISQPFIVALMTDLLEISNDDAVLEIGTGLGYQAAVLALLARKVFSIELIEELGTEARKRLEMLDCDNVELRIGNGSRGWPECSPFDKIIVTAAPDLIPAPLIYQVRPGGKMVIPAGLPDEQRLILVEKDGAGIVRTKEILPVRFSQLEEIE